MSTTGTLETQGSLWGQEGEDWGSMEFRPQDFDPDLRVLSEDNLWLNSRVEDPFPEAERKEREENLDKYEDQSRLLWQRASCLWMEHVLNTSTGCPVWDSLKPWLGEGERSHPALDVSNIESQSSIISLWDKSQSTNLSWLGLDFFCKLFFAAGTSPS